MAKKIFTIPVVEKLYECDLRYLEIANTGSYLYYIQATRSPRISHCIEKYKTFYESNLPSTILKFMELFDDNKHFDVIISSPSNTILQQPYFDKIIEKYNDAVNLTPSFSKISDVSSGATRNFEEIYNNISFELNTEVGKKDYENILIIDDFMADGKTVAAILQRLYNSGFSFNKHVVGCVLITDLEKNKKDEN